jgi:competence protein ComEA
MQRWALTILIALVLALCAVFLGLRWWQLARRAPEAVVPLQLSAALAVNAAEPTAAGKDGPASAANTLPKPEVAKPEQAGGNADIKPLEASGKININSATAEQLTKLPGIGEVLGARIVAYRKAHGPFKSVEGLLEVEGIGEGKLAKIKPRATAGK